MKRELTCIICPRGCQLTAEIQGDKVTVQGNSCSNGEEYAINECLHPVRTVTATVRVANRENTMLAVKTAAPVPKDRMFEVMDALRAISVQAPICLGDTVLTDILGTSIVATQTIR